MKQKIKTNKEHPVKSTDSQKYPEHSVRKLSPVQAKFFIFIFLLSTLMLGWVLWPFGQFLILAFLLAGIFRPIYNWLGKWVSAWMASGLTCGLITLIVFVPLTFCVGALSSEALNLLHLTLAAASENYRNHLLEAISSVYNSFMTHVY